MSRDARPVTFRGRLEVWQLVYADRPAAYGVCVDATGNAPLFPGRMLLGVLLAFASLVGIAVNHGVWKAWRGPPHSGEASSDGPPSDG
jgi:hypothetical protein